MNQTLGAIIVGDGDVNREYIIRRKILHEIVLQAW